MTKYFTSPNLFNDLQRTDAENVGVHALDSPNGAQITLYVNGPSLTFLAEITPLEETSQGDKLLRKMMVYAFPGLRLRGGALTINPNEKALVYSYEQLLNTLSKMRFESLLANFSTTAMELRQAVQQLKSS